MALVKKEMGHTWPVYCRIDLREEVVGPDGKKIANDMYGAPYKMTDTKAWQLGFIKAVEEIMKTSVGQQVGRRGVKQALTR